MALAKVDCTVEADLCREFGVEGYPTVKVFRGPDNVRPYQGARKAPAYVRIAMNLEPIAKKSTVSSHT